MEKFKHTIGKHAFQVCDDKPSELHVKAMTSLIEFMATFIDKPILIECVYDDVLGGLQICWIEIGKLTFYGTTSEDDDEILVICAAQHYAQHYSYECQNDISGPRLKRLLTTAP